MSRIVEYSDYDGPSPSHDLDREAAIEMAQHAHLLGARQAQALVLIQLAEEFKNRQRKYKGEAWAPYRAALRHCAGRCWEKVEEIRATR